MPPIPKHLENPPAPKTEWRRGRFYVTTFSGPEFVEADGFGGFFVSWNRTKRKWATIHMATGWEVVRFDDEDSARRAAEMLQDRCAEVFSANTPEEVRANAPDWLVQWVLVCDNLGVYLDPSETS